MPEFAYALNLLVATVVAFAAFNAVLNLQAQFLSAIVLGSFALIYGVAPLFLGSGNRPLTASFTCLAAASGLLFGRRVAVGLFGTPTALPVKSMFQNGATRYIVATQILGLAGALAFALGSAGSLDSYLASTRFEYRLDPSNGALALIGLYLMPFLTAPPLIMVLAKSKALRITGIVYGVMTSLGCFFFLKGTRSLAIGLLVGIMVLAAMSGTKQKAKRSASQQRHFVAVVAAGIIAMIVLPNMYQARHLLSSEDVSAQDVLIGDGQDGNSGRGSIFEQEPLNYSVFLQQAVDTFPDQHEYLWLYPIRRIAFFPLKSSDDGLKPPDTNATFAAALGQGGRSTTIPPSLPGEGYVVLGGVVGSALWAILYGLGIGWLESRQHRPHVALAVIVVGFSNALLALRGQFYELALSMTATIVMCAFLVRVIRPRPDAAECSQVDSPSVKASS